MAKKTVGDIDKEYELTDLLLPQPQKLGDVNSVKYFGEGMPAPTILIPKNAEKQTIAGAALISEKMTAILSSNGEVVITDDPNKIKSGSLVISIGKTEYFTQHKDTTAWNEISDKEQGYIITYQEPNIILAGSGPIGDYYAASTLVQLLEQEDFIIQCAEIVVYPDFLLLSCSCR